MMSDEVVDVSGGRRHDQEDTQAGSWVAGENGVGLRTCRARAMWLHQAKCRRRRGQSVDILIRLSGGDRDVRRVLPVLCFNRAPVCVHVKVCMMSFSMMRTEGGPQVINPLGPTPWTSGT